ncbi:hypothetical protein O3G_MSEX004986 [Manduca sexta]|uniref:Mitochondrial 2-oxoglutarate/malate carrier protein n=1 Tax=Manduca sexta TaxID=7130 RepID=A0A921YY23_MANSE|nr:hypothetical protein O3G_MSEX004986 [Manduca sexta]
MMSICIVQPADLVKTRMQLIGKQGGKKVSTSEVVKQIAKTEGIFGFYHGLSAALFRQATYTTGRMGCFNTLFDYHTRYYGSPIYPVRVAMGLIAGGVGAFIGTPADVALVRMTADGRLPPEKRRNYKNVFNALGRIIREEGFITLWSGATATITRAMVVNGVQLATYSQTMPEVTSVKSVTNKDPKGDAFKRLLNSIP